MILFIDTASADNRVAVLDNDLCVVEERVWSAGRDQAELVLPAVSELVGRSVAKSSGKSVGISGGDFLKLERVIVVTGPGPFTGVRIGIAVANALSYALSIPATGVRLDHLERYGSIDKVPENLFSKDGFTQPYYKKPPNITESKK